MNKKIIAFMAILTLISLYGAQAQQPAKMARIGILTPDSISSRADLFETFRQGLRELGYIEGQNVAIEWRSAEGRSDRLPTLATELVSLKLDVILALTPAAVRAAKEASLTMPIVMVVGGDPIAFGLIDSFARPGGNITGVTVQPQELSGKRMELLKEAAPKISRIAVFSNPDLPGLGLRFPELQVEARSWGITLQSMEVRNPNELVSAFEAAARERSDALLMPQPGFSNVHRKRLVEFAAKNRLPAMYPESTSVEAGGLMSYGADLADSYRRVAVYVDKILKGAKPAELPVEQPKKFEFVINLQAAKQIGLTIPPNVLARADRVIK